MRARRLFATLFVAVALTSCKSVDPTNSLSGIDRAAVAAVTHEYRDAWLANDDKRVMATLVRDAVLVPAGMAPIEGHEAIRDFWFAPSTTPTIVIRMEQDVTDVIGGGDAAIVTGRGSVTFQT